MSDHFEQKMQEIALRTVANGGPQIPDVLSALVATNEDFDDSRKAVDKKLDLNHTETLTLLEEHIKSDDERAKDIAGNLAEWQKNQALRCVEEHRKLLERKPRRSTDPNRLDYTIAANDDPPETLERRRKYTREQLVANFWILVGLLMVSGIVNGLLDMLFHH